MDKLKKAIVIFSLIVSIMNANVIMTNASESNDFDKLVNEIVNNSGVPRYAIENDIIRISERTKQEVNIVARLLLDEVLSSISYEDKSLTRSSGEGTISMISSTYGDLWYSNAYTLVWNHGHIGMYETNNTIIEARGPGYTVAARMISNMKALSGDKILAVSSSANSNSRINYTYRIEATEWAKTRKGKGYAYTLDNKYCGAYHDYNCSQLVWCSYYNTSKQLDLDSDGGNFVSPGNIMNSSYTYVVHTY